MIDELRARTSVSGIGRVEYVRAVQLINHDSASTLWKWAEPARLALTLPSTFELCDDRNHPSKHTISKWERVRSRTWAQAYYDGHNELFREIERCSIEGRVGTVLERSDGNLQLFIADCWSDDPRTYRREKDAKGWQPGGLVTMVMDWGIPLFNDLGGKAGPNAIKPALPPIVANPVVQSNVASVEPEQSAGEYKNVLQITHVVPDHLYPKTSKDSTDLRISTANDLLQQKVIGKRVTLVFVVAGVTEQRDAGFPPLKVSANEIPVGPTPALISALFPEEAKVRLAGLSVGDTVTVDGEIRQCYFFRRDQAVPLVVNLFDSKIVHVATKR